MVHHRTHEEISRGERSFPFLTAKTEKERENELKVVIVVFLVYLLSLICLGILSNCVECFWR